MHCDPWCDRCPRDREVSCASYRIIGVHIWGGHAEYVKVPARNAVAVPDGVSFEQACTLGVSYLTTWHGVMTKARTTSADTVLVMAAGGAVGAAAIQIAKLQGAEVFATTGSERKQARALELGADAVFDYNDPDWPSQVRDATNGRGVTILFDNVGAETWEQSLSRLARGARVVCSGATGSPIVTLHIRALYRSLITLHFYTQHQDGARGLAAHVEAGRLDPVIDSVFPLAEARQAQERLEAMQQFGKIVLRP